MHVRQQHPRQHLFITFLSDLVLDARFKPICQLDANLFHPDGLAVCLTALWNPLNEEERQQLQATRVLGINSSHGLHGAFKSKFQLGEWMAKVRMPNSTEGPALFVPPSMRKCTIAQLLHYYVTTTVAERIQPPAAWPKTPARIVRTVRSRDPQGTACICCHECRLLTRLNAPSCRVKVQHAMQ